MLDRKWAVHTSVRLLWLIYWMPSSNLALLHDLCYAFSFQFHGERSYMIADNVVFLVITDKSYPRKLAFSYLDELHKEFQNSYGSQVETVRKPYAFVKFGACPVFGAILFHYLNDFVCVAFV